MGNHHIRELRYDSYHIDKIHGYTLLQFRSKTSELYLFFIKIKSKDYRYVINKLKYGNWYKIKYTEYAKGVGKLVKLDKSI